jgi:hypothetical protein
MHETNHDLKVSVFFAMFYALVFVKDLLQDVFATHALAMSFVL